MSLLERLIRNWWNRWRGQQNPHSDFSRWEQDYVLQDFNHLGLFYEYLEMGERLMTGRTMLRKSISDRCLFFTSPFFHLFVFQ